MTFFRKSCTISFASLAAMLLVGTHARADETAPIPPRGLPQPDTRYSFAQPRPYPTLAWWAAQLVPSPELAISGSGDAAFGLRWQVSPVLWSWGVNRRVDRWRFFVVDPIARHSGSIELDAHLEYIWGHVDRFLTRPTVRATFPIAHRGEYLSVSLGTSTYVYDDQWRLAYEGGVYFLAGLVGVQGAYAPNHSALSTLITFRLKYF